MGKKSSDRKSSTIPVRISTLEREESGQSRSELRRTQTLKPKQSNTGSADSSHIPKSRRRASSCDRLNTKSNLIKVAASARTPLRQYGQHGPTTPVTPKVNPNRAGLLSSGNSIRKHLALPTGRRSVSADRGSSIGGKCQKKDGRPLTDKFYQADMLSKIDNYFHSNHQTSMINSNGSLKPITLKMFVEVTDYLLKSLDIKQTLTIINYIEELPKVAKKLHYPGVVAKSWLKTANAMHSWPNVLGWLCWLVEVCEIRKIALEKFSFDNLPFTGSDREARANKHFFFYMVNMYTAFNEEKPDEEDALTESLLKQMNQQQGVSDEELQEAELKVNAEMKKLNAAKEDAKKLYEEVKHLTSVQESLENEKATQLSEIYSYEEYIENESREIQQLQEDSAIYSEQKHALNVQRDELISLIKDQPMSKNEKDNILRKCTETQDYVDQFEAHLQDIQNELYNLDMKLASINNNLNKYVLAYNKEIFMHLNTDIGVDIEELKMPETGLLDSQIMDTLNHKAELMKRTKDYLKKQLAERQLSIEAHNKEIDSIEERIKVLQDKSTDITNKIKDIKQQKNKIKADAEVEESRLAEQIKTIQCDIQQMQESMPNLQELMTEVEQVKDKMEAVNRRKQRIEQTAKLFFENFYKILGDHRREMYNILSKSKQFDK